MLRIHQNTRPADAKRYYCTSGYYTQGHELEMVGDWGGQGAKRLGLEGAVSQSAFERLCDNLHPLSAEQLTPRQRGDRTVGYDFNFNAPKSVSVLYARYQDAAILEAFRESVRETMDELEAETKTRVRKGRQNAERVTGNLTWSEFVHFTARPVDGVPDQALHAHCFVFNQTFDAVEGRWKAAQFRDLKRDAPYWEAAFHARLAGKMAALGYGIERHGKDWDVAGLSPELLRKFSRRTALIEEKSNEMGVTSAARKSAIGALTREKKPKELSWEELRTHWQSQLTQGEREQLDRVQARSEGGEGAVVSAGEAMQRAVDHLFERSSVVPEKRLLASALRFGLGHVSVADMHRELSRHGILRIEQNGQTMVTTREVLGEEQAMLAFAREGRGACRPLAAGHHLSRDWLNEGQRRAVTHVLESSDRVMVIRGVAGTGKTTLTKEAVEAIEATGRNVTLVAPTAQASRGVLRSEGFAGAETIDKLLNDKALQRALTNGVLWIDEAGLAGVRDMARLFALAAERNARVVVMGDARQHRAVARGSALRLLEKEAGIVPVEVRDIQRQRGAYRDAVAAMADGKAKAGFDKLDGLGWIHEAPDGSQHEQLAADFAAAVKRGENVLVISPTHREGERVTRAIRDELRERGLLGKSDQHFLKLTSLNLTEAERADPASYRDASGPLVVQFVQNAPGFTRGERAQVIAVENRSVKVRLQSGAESALPLAQAKRFQVYRSSTLPLASGDKVRITQNGYAGEHRLNNGAVYQVAGFTSDGGIRLENNWELPADFGHLANGLVVTSHASQGRTVDRVLIAQSADSLAATGQEQLYVSASRGRVQAAVYTDDKHALRDAIAHSDMAMSATETFRPRVRPKSRVTFTAAHLQRIAVRTKAYASRLLDTSREQMADRSLLRG